MHDVLDIIKNVQTLYAVGPTLSILKDFERVVDELDVYVFQNWEEVKVKVEIKYASGEIKTIQALCRIDTKNELEYYKNGGILQYVLRNMI